MGVAIEPSCRLYAILARDGRSAVVFRRGPTKQVLVLRWWLDNDRLEPGQWFKGRIYERRCDLSPDGELLIYFAANWKAPYQSWTAVSRTPYLTALALWPKGDAWGGGGLFLSPRTIGLNHLAVSRPVYPIARRVRHAGQDIAAWHPLDADPPRSKKSKEPSPAPQEITLPRSYAVRRWHDTAAGRGEDNPVHHERMSRAGWTCVAVGDAGPYSSGSIAWDFRSPEIYERHAPSGQLRLQRMLNAIGERDGRWYVEDHAICDAQGETLRLIPECSWADWQTNGDLLFAISGSLYRLPSRFCGDAVSDPLVNAKLVADLTPLRFSNVAPPASALSWP